MGAILQLEWNDSKLGKAVNLTIKSENFQGIYLDDKNGNRVLCTNFDALYNIIGKVTESGSCPEQKDPWKHRSCGMKCQTCMWFVQKTEITTNCWHNPPKVNQKIVGRCRRHAPTMTGYPVCYEDDWCGDHKLDETKV